jgi:putative membrane protein
MVVVAGILPSVSEIAASRENENLRPAIGLILGLSAAAFIFLLWLLYFRGRENGDPGALSILPGINAALNGTAAVCITAGLIAIKTGRRRLHMGLMITAIVLSAIFLVSYITYHNLHGDTKFATPGTMRYVYFGVLISHIACTAFALPLIISAVYFAATRRFALHKRVTKYTYPIWLYVSVTGVLIYFLLRANS